MIKYTTTDTTSYDGDKARAWLIDESGQWPKVRAAARARIKKWKQFNVVLRWKKLGKNQLEFKPIKYVITSCADGVITLSLIK